MEKIKISLLSDMFSSEEVEYIKSNFSIPHECHKNCLAFCWYCEKRYESIRFVVVSIAEFNGKPVPGLGHCVVKIGNRYFDPTLDSPSEFYLDYEYTVDEITDIYEAEHEYLIPFEPRQDKKTREWYRYRGTQKEFCHPHVLL